MATGDDGGDDKQKPSVSRGFRALRLLWEQEDLWLPSQFSAVFQGNNKRLHAIVSDSLPHFSPSCDLKVGT